MYKDIDLKTAKKYLENEFNQSKIPNLKLYKGINNSIEINDILFSSTKTEVRQSKTLNKNGNSYNLLLNNLENWKNLPLRKQSIIITNNLDTAISFANNNDNNIDKESFGKVFRVIPELHANLIISPSNDIWYSFPKGLSSMKIRGQNTSLLNFNQYIQEIAIAYDINDFDKDWKTFIYSLEKIQSNELGLKNELSFNANLVLDWIKSLTKNIIDSFEEVFDPTLNNFTSVKYDSSNSFKDSANNEIWTDSNSLLINIDLEEEFGI